MVRALEDGWLLYRPEQEFLSLVGASSADWRLSKARQTLYTVCPMLYHVIPCYTYTYIIPCYTMYQVNAEYTVCPSYPGCCIVPATVTDTQLEAAARYHVTLATHTV